MLSFIINWLNTPVFETFGAPTTWAEILGFITGAACVYLVARASVWNWGVGIINNIMWIILFLSVGLYADSGLQVVFITLSVIGWINWLRGGTNKTELPISRTSVKQWAGILAGGVAAYFTLYFILTNYTPSTVPTWDALIVTLSLMALYGQIVKVIESWLIWLCVDAISVPLYIHKGLTLTAILYVGFGLLCVYGLITWIRIYRKEQAALVETETVTLAAAEDVEVK